MKFKNIAVSGSISSGKTTLARNLAAKLGWKYVSAGEFFRSWHKQNNIPLNESDKVPEEIDREIDSGFAEKMKNEDNVVFESHLAGFLGKDIKTTLKVLCRVDDGIRIERAAKRDGVSLDEARKDCEERAFSIYSKFKKLYDVDAPFKEDYFDLVVDTSVKSPEEVIEEVLKKLEDDV